MLSEQEIQQIFIIETTLSYPSVSLTTSLLLPLCIISVSNSLCSLHHQRSCIYPPQIPKDKSKTQRHSILKPFFSHDMSFSQPPGLCVSCSWDAVGVRWQREAFGNEIKLSFGGLSALIWLWHQCTTPFSVFACKSGSRWHFLTAVCHQDFSNNEQHGLFELQQTFPF